MQLFFNTISRYFLFVRGVFSSSMVPFHLTAVCATAVCVFGGFDYAYLQLVLLYVPMRILFTADIVGFIMPIVLPAVLFLYARRSKSVRTLAAASASIYAVALGFTLSMFIKVFTGRTSPPHPHSGRSFNLYDNSHDFHFGFMREQIMGGWPSSHTTVSFALAVALMAVFPPSWRLRAMLTAYACFVGVGVTFGFHWFSEFIAGACLGTAIGLVVGNAHAHIAKQPHVLSSNSV